MTQKKALQDLLVAIEAGSAVQQDEGWMHLPCTRHDDGKMSSHMGRAWRSYHGSMDAAKALHDAVLPGWWYQVGSCHLSDDARVSPDFNCPVHGADLALEYDPSIDWADLTDVDQRPAGNPARAWLTAQIKALIAGCDE